MQDPPIDNTEICPACDGSGEGVADTMCNLCGGSGGVERALAYRIHAVLHRLDSLYQPGDPA